MNITKAVALGAFLVTTLAAGAAMAKGHNQGGTDEPGATAGSFTVKNAITEGTEQGNRPADKTPTPNEAALSAGRPS